MCDIEVNAIEALRTNPERNIPPIAKKYGVDRNILENGIRSLTSFSTHNNDMLYSQGQKEKILH